MMTNLVKEKNSSWLDLEVCRDFQWGKCSRLDTDCKFAHPPINVDIRNGRVTTCFDFIKDRCNRRTPPCRYYHPLKHLKDQLFINGRKCLALKNVIPQRMESAPSEMNVLPGQVPFSTERPYLIGWNPLVNAYLVPSSINVGLVSPQFMSARSELQAQNIHSYQKLNVHHHQRLNEDLFNGTRSCWQNIPSNRLCRMPIPQDKVDLAIHQARMSAYYAHLLMAKQLSTQNLEKF